MRYFRIFRTRAANRPFRAKRSFRTIGMSVLLLGSLASPTDAAHEPPTITQPAPGETLPGPNITVGGTVAGDVQVVRIFEGATVLGETGPIGGYWSIDLPFADGPHTIRARGRDALLAWSAFSDPLSFQVDTSVPVAPAIVSPSDGAIVTFNTVTIEGNAEPGARVRLEISTGGAPETVADGAGNWAIARAFSDATHGLVARAIDAAGNVSLPSTPVTFTVDTLAPAAPIIDTPGDGAVVRPQNILVSGRAEPGSTVRVSEGVVIGTVVATSAGTWWFTHTFSEGVHTITARTTDAAGHVSPASAPMTFRVDVTAPGIPTITVPAENAIVPHRYTVRGAAEPHARVQLLFNAAVLAETTSTAGGSWSIELSSFSGPKSLQARAIDAAGNLGGLSPVRSFIVDADHPSVRIETHNGAIFLPTQTPTIEGTATDNFGVLGIDVHVFDLLGRDVLTRNAQCLACPLGTEVEWSIAPALPPGQYVVKAWAVDRAGNRSLEAQVTYIEI